MINDEIEKGELNWEGKIILYSKYSGKITKAFLKEDVFVVFQKGQEIKLQKSDIDKIEVGTINFVQRLFNSVFIQKIVIWSKKIDSGKIEFVVTKGRGVSKGETLAFYKKLKLFFGKDLPDLESIVFNQSKNTIKNYAILAGIGAVAHFLITRSFTLIEVGAIVFIASFVIGEMLRRGSKVSEE